MEEEEEEDQEELGVLMPTCSGSPPPGASPHRSSSLTPAAVALLHCCRSCSSSRPMTEQPDPVQRGSGGHGGLCVLQHCQKDQQKLLRGSLSLPLSRAHILSNLSKPLTY